jgi:transcriptional regulator with XRE-family HTH domain
MADHPVKTDGNAIRALRIAKGLQVRELAQAAGITGSAMSGIEFGRSNGSPQVLVKVAARLGVPVTDLLRGVPQRIAA